MINVIFKQLNKEKFAEFVFDMKECLPKDAELNRESSCFSINLSTEVIKEIIAAKTLSEGLKKKIMEVIPNDPVDREQIMSIQNFWNENVNELFFEEIEKYMPGCSAQEYMCYVTDKMVGSYFENNGEVVMKYKKGKSNGWLASIVAEEILHLIYWNFWKKTFNIEMSLDSRFNIGEGDVNGWSISETIPEYLLIENPRFRKLGWDKINRIEGYSWLTKVRKSLDPLWEKSKTFKEFIIEAHDLCGFKKK